MVDDKERLGVEALETIRDVHGELNNETYRNERHV